MKTHLIYLHIDKTAGSAQRSYFHNAIGTDNVYWHGVPPNTQQNKSMYEYFIIGGHNDYALYENNDLIYMSVVRNPVERVLSFFNYCKEVIPDQWVPEGLDVHSLKNTLKSCKAFRLAITNAQCRYLSGRGSYDNVIDNIFKNLFCIGCLDSVDDFNENIASNLGLYYKELSLCNVGKKGYAHEIEIDDECVAEIENIVAEDIRLYKFISEDCKGLYSNVSDARWQLAKSALKLAKSALRAGLVVTQVTGSLLVVSPVSSMVVGARASIGVEIINRSEQTWVDDTSLPVLFSYHWLKDSGEVLIYDGLRSPLPEGGVGSGQKLATEMLVEAPPDAGTYTLVLTLLQERVRWFEDMGFEAARLVVEVNATSGVTP